MFLCLAFLIVNASVIFFTFYTLSIGANYKTQFAFDETKFQLFITEAVTNYLSRFDLGKTDDKLKSSASSSPEVVMVSGCTWLTPRREYRCLLEGVEYGVNDFSPYGFIIYISDGRVYAKDGDSIKIIRVVHTPADDASAPRERRRPEDGRALVNRPYLNEEGETNEY